MSDVRFERSAKRVRAYLGGNLVADTTSPVLVWENGYFPIYYVPAEDVRAELDGATVRAGDAEAPDAAQHGTGELDGLVRLKASAFDWFEEDEQVFSHPRDPYHRVDVLPSSRHVRIEVDGVTIAESSSPTLLFETNLPVRYYLPKTHVRMDLLEPTATVTTCPYKGTAEYWSVRVGDTTHEDIVWGYAAPLPESTRVQGLVAFYDEKVDVYVDGVRQ
ncbi:DUF427 domain-containing protein [Actinomadura rayongensis]|uniref:DUF427 domain-containing protein n=1 Tax=Actinomadura rayongensis TaxID=1429076 RepID=A0A6I4W6B1_9ACTN|nr:DUF427 domain-containing protein [Actinomadura rayongensis]MXQ65031.1 DUF427 domain-containing protein [Actinomadura rayongensis]